MLLIIARATQHSYCEIQSQKTDKLLCVGIEMLQQWQTVAWYRSWTLSLVKRLFCLKFSRK